MSVKFYAASFNKPSVYNIYFGRPPKIQYDYRSREKKHRLQTESRLSFEYYLSEGNTYKHIGDYRHAVIGYTKALDLRPAHKICLLSRSQCYLMLGHTDAALADIDATLSDDANFIKGILQKANTYYQMGEFEFALVLYHRGRKLRPDVDSFRLGIQLCKEAIENCIGEKANIRLEKKGDLSFFTKLQQSSLSQSEAQTKRDYRRIDLYRNNTTSIVPDKDEKTVKKLLENLYVDKQYLENIILDTENVYVKSKQTDGVKQVSEDCLRYLKGRATFWQQKQSLYARSKAAKLPDVRYSRLPKKAEGKTTSDILEWILKNLKKMDEYFWKESYEDCLATAFRVLEQLDVCIDKENLGHLELRSTVLSYIGDAYFEMHNYRKALKYHRRDYSIANKHRLRNALIRSQDNICRTLIKQEKFAEAIVIFEQRRPMATDALERAWLHHEIGHCYLKLANYHKALEHGLLSLEAAEEADDWIWQSNALNLIAEALRGLMRLTEAIETYEKLLKMANLMNETQAASAIQRIIDELKNELLLRVTQDDAERQSEKLTETATIEGSQRDKETQTEPEWATEIVNDSAGENVSSQNERDEERLQSSDEFFDELKDQTEEVFETVTLEETGTTMIEDSQRDKETQTEPEWATEIVNDSAGENVSSQNERDEERLQSSDEFFDELKDQTKEVFEAGTLVEETGTAMEEDYQRSRGTQTEPEIDTEIVNNSASENVSSQNERDELRLQSSDDFFELKDQTKEVFEAATLVEETETAMEEGYQRSVGTQTGPGIATEIVNDSASENVSSQNEAEVLQPVTRPDNVEADALEKDEAMPGTGIDPLIIDTHDQTEGTDLLSNGTEQRGIDIGNEVIMGAIVETEEQSPDQDSNSYRQPEHALEDAVHGEDEVLLRSDPDDRENLLLKEGIDERITTNENDEIVEAVVEDNVDEHASDALENGTVNGIPYEEQALHDAAGPQDLEESLLENVTNQHEIEDDEMVEAEENQAGNKTVAAAGIATYPSIDSDNSQQTSEYAVTIKISDIENAGTTNPLFLQIVGDRGSSKLVPLDASNTNNTNGRNLFERDSENTFTISAANVGEIFSVCLVCQTGLDPASEPHIADITIRYKNSNEAYLFECNEWLFKMKDRELTSLM